MSDEFNTKQQFNAQEDIILPEVVVTAKPILPWHHIWDKIWDKILHQIWKSIFATIDPLDTVFIDPTLSYQDMRNGYRLRANPLGTGLWRVNAAGRPHPYDERRCLRQEKLIYLHMLPAIETVANGLSQEPINTINPSPNVNIDLISGFKQAVKDAIADGLLPNPATMQGDYKFIEGGLSTPILKILSVSGGFMLDKKGNVYLIMDGSGGASLGLPLPVTGSVGTGIFFGNAEKNNAAAYREALAGGSLGTTTGAGIQGTMSISRSGVVSGEVSLSPSITKSVGGRYAWYLFNVFD